MSPSWKALICSALFGIVNAAVVQTRVRGAGAELDTLDKRASGKVQMGYFTNWGIYGRNFQPDDMDTSSLTHVLYAFADTDGSSGAIELSDTYADTDKHYPDDSWNDVGNNVYGCIKRLFLIKLKQRNLKTILSIGGWTYSQSGHFNFVTSSSARATFVSNALTMLENFGFDGIDLDFEFPTPAQKAGFSSLVNELRTALDKHASSKGDTTPYLVTIAVSAGQDNYVNYDVKGMNGALSFWNLMAYDYAGSWSNVSADLANVFGGDTGFSTDSALSWYLSSGATASKITLGIPIYGRGFESTNGIYQPYSGNGVGTWEAGVYDYKALPFAGATVVENSATMASYSYDASKKELISYDTPNIAAKKATYANSKGLAGSMYWELSADKTGSASLVKTVGNAFGSLDQSQNHINYPGSIYDNIRNNMGSSPGTPSTSSPSSGPTGSPGSGNCAGVPAWTSGTVFTGGQRATFNGHLWTAKWWTQGDTPGGQAGVWTDNGAC